MPADREPDPIDRWLNQQVRPLPPPPGTFELITRRARRRKIRRAAVSVASAAAVAAAIAVAVPLGLSIHLTPTTTGAGLAAGSPPKRSTVSPASPPRPAAPVPSASSSGASVSGSGSKGPSNPGYLPPDFVPSAVTWDSLSTGWVIGPAGTPGACANANPDICTSVARTDDGGQTWTGLPAPPVGGPESATGVTGLRFLNADYGWAFGPELWSTDNGGETWQQVSTGGSSVTDLETADGRAYALFGDCSPPAGGTGDTIADCSSYTLETTVAGSGSWTPVGGVPAGLAQPGGSGSALIVLDGPAGTTAATGYLAAPDGTLYAGPLDGGAWHKVAALPCTPGPAADSGLPEQLMLAAAGASPSGADRLALVCAHPTVADTVVYTSDDGGASWTRQSRVAADGTALIGQPQSLAATADGTLILATTGSGSGSGGIYLLPAGATTWQKAALSDPSGSTYGFSYVGMTSALQGVALGGNPDLHAIWMTTDGGQTWTVQPIKSS